MSQDNTPNPEGQQPEDFRKQSAQIWKIGGLLGLGAAIVTFLGTTNLSTKVHIGILFPVIIVQAALQVLLFMHLKSEKNIIFKFLLFTLVFVFALFFLTHLADSNPLQSKIIPVR